MADLMTQLMSQLSNGEISLGEACIKLEEVNLAPTKQLCLACRSGGQSCTTLAQVPKGLLDVDIGAHFVVRNIAPLSEVLEALERAGVSFNENELMDKIGNME